MDEILLTVENANEIEKMLLQSPNSSIRILKSPYDDNPIVVSSDAVGEVKGATLAEAISNFRDHLFAASAEVAVEEEVVAEESNEDIDVD